MSEAVKEKKVEYLELIYDLIFVYIIGRNNMLLHHTEGGFVPAGPFIAYILCSLAVIQIWNYSTFYENLYGRNSIRDHVFLFINMYLLYHMADGTSISWQNEVYHYSIAWALILINIGVQHLIEARNHKNAPWEQKACKSKALIILSEAALVGVHMLIYRFFAVSTPYIPILFGMAAMLVSGKKNRLVPVEFSHLTERAMLYIVFTFGEMIISIASYFGDGFSFNDMYFSIMAFLIVVGLFLTYGVIYNKIIDRETSTNGVFYMFLHIFIILALNNISVSLEFMRDVSVDILQKTLFLTGSFILYFVFAFLTMIYAKKRCGFGLRFALSLSSISACFIALMLVFREKMLINIAITVVFVFGIFFFIYTQSKKIPE